jgi:hypothetical protein
VLLLLLLLPLSAVASNTRQGRAYVSNSSSPRSARSREQGGLRPAAAAAAAAPPPLMLQQRLLLLRCCSCAVSSLEMRAACKALAGSRGPRRGAPPCAPARGGALCDPRGWRGWPQEPVSVGARRGRAGLARGAPPPHTHSLIPALRRVAPSCAGARSRIRSRGARRGARRRLAPSGACAV